MLLSSVKLTVSRGPANRPPHKRSSPSTRCPVYLRYAGVTAVTTPSGRNEEDQEMSRTLWTNLTSVLGAAPKVYTVPGAYHWQPKGVIGTYTADLAFECATHDYRMRIDLQDIERTLISCIFPLRGNSAPGGYHHQPDLDPYPAVPLPRCDADDETAERLRSLNKRLDQHHQDARDIWSTKADTRISDAAAADAHRNSRVLSLVQGGVGLVHVAKDIPKEAFLAQSLRRTGGSESRRPHLELGLARSPRCARLI